jgi:hypothetical protein
VRIESQVHIHRITGRRTTGMNPVATKSAESWLEGALCIDVQVEGGGGGEGVGGRAKEGTRER